MDVKLELDTTVCRVCLLDHGDMVPIFDASGVDTVISLKISQCLSIELTNDINMPEHICAGCLVDLEAAYRFRANYEGSDAILKSFVETAALGEISNGDIQPGVDEKVRITPSPPPAPPAPPMASTAASRVIADDAIIEGMEFVSVDRGMLKVKVLGEDQYVEYRVNVSDVDLRSDTATFHLVNDDRPGDPLPANTVNMAFEESTDATTTIGEVIEGDQQDTAEAFIEETAPSIVGTVVNVDDHEYVIIEETDEVVAQYASDNVVEVDHVSNLDGDDDYLDPDKEVLQIKPVKSNKSRLSGRGQPAALAATAAAAAAAAAASARTAELKRRLAELRPPKVCEICGNEYKYKHALDGHMRRHRNEKPFECHICGKGFVINFELSRHMRTHTGHKPYACSYCERRFSDFGSRVKHERTHTGERPYSCELCGKAFAYSHVLASHMLTHTGEKRFGCEMCGKRFSKSHHLKAHLNTHRVRPMRGGIMSVNSGSCSGMRAVPSTSKTSSSSHLGIAQPQHSIDDDGRELLDDGDDDDDDDVDVDQPEQTDHVDVTGLQGSTFSESDLMMDIAGQIIMDEETGENYMLELAEDEKATVQLMQFNASDLIN